MYKINVALWILDTLHNKQFKNGKKEINVMCFVDYFLRETRERINIFFFFY